MHRRRYKRREERRYIQDDLFNMVELTLDIQDFTHRMFLIPELGVVLAHRAMLQEFRAVLSTKGEQPQLVSYDTTYNLGNFLCHHFYLGTLCSRVHQSCLQLSSFTRRGLYSLMRFLWTSLPKKFQKSLKHP